MKLLDILLSPWALPEDRLQGIRSLYFAHVRGEKLDLKAWEAATGRAAGTERQPYSVQDGVAVIPVQGVLTKVDSAWNRLCGMTSTALLRKDLAAALADEEVHGIVLHIDSPGGMVDGTQELSDAVFAARAVKPILAFADGCMCSGAYWVGSAAERILVSSDTASVGSIGVVATHVDVSKAEEQYGEKTTEITAGKYKRVASRYAPLSDEGRATLQGYVDHIYSVFVDQVARNRDVPVEQVLLNMADGRVFVGRQAIEAGLVDGVSTLDRLIAELNDRRRDHRPGAGAASLPSTPPSQETLMNITREQLAAEAPELLTAIQSEARGEELARVKGCLDTGLPGYEAMAQGFAFDGKTLPTEAAHAINQAQKADLQAAAAHAQAGRPPVVPDGPDPDRIDAEARKAAAEAATKKPEPADVDWGARITAHIAKAAGEGRTLTAAQAAIELRKQDKE